MDKLMIIDNEGIVTLYSDDLVGLGEPKIERASNVEFGIVPGSKGWDVVLTAAPRNGIYAHMVIVDASTAIRQDEAARGLADGTYKPFTTRQAALDVEVAFIQNMILGKE